MRRLSNNFATWTGIIFVVVGTSFIIYLHVSMGSQYLWPFTINVVAIIAAISFMLIKLKIVYFDKNNLYYKTLFFSPLNEIPLKRIYNMVKVYPINPLQPVYKIMYFDETDTFRSISFIKSINYISEDLYEILDLKRP